MEMAFRDGAIQQVQTSHVPATSEVVTRVTIGIPAYNEKGSIGFLISRLLSEADPHVVEIIVSDDGSTDGTSVEVLRITGKTRKNCCSVEIIKGKRRLGKAAAIDKILKAAQGNIIVLIDADTQISKDCVGKIVAPFLKDENLGVVSGNVLQLGVDDEGGFLSFVSVFQRELSDRLCRQLMDKELAPKVNGAFFAFRKEIVDHIPHTVVSDDEYISWYAQSRGYKVIYAPDAKVYAKDTMHLKDYLSKRRRILGGHFLMRNSSRYKVPTTRIAALLPEFGKLTMKHWKRILPIATMLLLEALCYPLAFCDAFQRKVSPRYRLDSAKLSLKVESRGDLLPI